MTRANNVIAPYSINYAIKDTNISRRKLKLKKVISVYSRERTN